MTNNQFIIVNALLDIMRLDASVTVLWSV